MKKCTGCGREYDYNAGFCSYCGIPLELLIAQEYVMEQNYSQTYDVNYQPQQIQPTYQMEYQTPPVQAEGPVLQQH